jgi:hypothetical protein
MGRRIHVNDRETYWPYMEALQALHPKLLNLKNIWWTAARALSTQALIPGP